MPLPGDGVPFTDPFYLAASDGSGMERTPNFEILDWHPAYKSCQKYFLDVSQHDTATQSVCALVNIRLPYQWRTNPVPSSREPSRPTSSPTSSSSATMKDWTRATVGLAHDSQHGPDPVVFVSLVPYIRRLIVTGFDTDGILHGFFGDAWQAGIGPFRECERRNYLFAAKHGGWRSCKRQYDLNEEETVPFLQPLRDVTAAELESAENSWSKWLAQEDWMIGPRAPQHMDTEQRSGGGAPINTEHVRRDR